MNMSYKILLVEDELDLVEITKSRLEHSGYEVLAVPSGEEALALLQSSLPDLILLDLLLPGMRGEEVCKKVKMDAHLKQIPVILYTASAGDIENRTREVNADDYIIKPFEIKDLLSKIKKLIR
jgi:DNA-binding response OmpR family regulator